MNGKNGTAFGNDEGSGQVAEASVPPIAESQEAPFVQPPPTEESAPRSDSSFTQIAEGLAEKYPGAFEVRDGEKGPVYISRTAVAVGHEWVRFPGVSYFQAVGITAGGLTLVTRREPSDHSFGEDLSRVDPTDLEKAVDTARKEKMQSPYGGGYQIFS